jgi:hypothetical protein
LTSYSFLFGFAREVIYKRNFKFLYSHCFFRMFVGYFGLLMLRFDLVHADFDLGNFCS